MLLYLGDKQNITILDDNTVEDYVCRVLSLSDSTERHCEMYHQSFY